MPEKYLPSYPRLVVVTQLPRILSKRERCHWEEMIGQWIDEGLGVSERRISHIQRCMLVRFLRLCLEAFVHISRFLLLDIVSTLRLSYLEIKQRLVLEKERSLCDSVVRLKGRLSDEDSWAIQFLVCYRTTQLSTYQI